MTVVMKERLPSVIFEGLSRDQTERLTLDGEVAETYGFKTEVQLVSANALLWVIGRCLSTGLIGPTTGPTYWPNAWCISSPRVTGRPTSSS